MKIKYDVKHTHVWTIGEFSKKMQMENGMELESRKFGIKVGDKIVDWHVSIYPNGKMDASISHISAYLVKLSKTKLSVDVKYTFSFVDLEGFISNSRTHETTFIQSQSHGDGKKKFISHSNLTNLIFDDTLTIMCSAHDWDGEASTSVATRPLWVLEVEKGSGEDQKGRINSHKVIST